MLYFIVNPASSSGKGMKIWEKTKNVLEERQIRYHCIMLHKKGQTRRAAEKISELTKEVTVVLVGGDGTVNEFVTGLTRRSHVTLGIIRTGSGNDFASALDLPTDPEEMLDLILSGKGVRPLTTGIAETPGGSFSFAVSSGMGLDAAVCEASNASGGKSILNTIGLGKLIYTLQGLKALISNPVISMTIETENETLTFDKVYFAVVMNTKYEGGGYMFAPDADPSDDVFDLVIAEGISRPRSILMMKPARKGRHVDKKGIHIIRCSRVHITTDRPACLHTDGEVPGYYDEVTYSLSEDRLRTITGLD